MTTPARDSAAHPDERARLDERVRLEIQRGADVADYFSTLATKDLHAILRSTETRPLEQIVNTGNVRIDFGKRRIFRDIYWKGSFAPDTALGWEERTRTKLLHPDLVSEGKVFAGGSFWKRFDKVENGVATGEVVNYNIDWLPGDPEVRMVEYPDDKRQYLAKGQSVLLLRYRNHPYRRVYDLIKIIDSDDAIGVMHIGDFPNGTELASFVLARHNYPFELATDEDRAVIAASGERR
jgi:hypothetical protein